MPKIAAGATNKNISIAPHGTGKVVVGTGAADATVQSDGDHNLILQTGNSTTSKIEINDGANGDVAITPNGTGNLTIDNIAISDNTIKSTDTNGNIDLTPDGTGEVNISKVDIDGGAIDGTNVTVGSGKTLDVSAGTLTSSTAQKQAIVDGAAIEGDEILATGESGTFLGADGDDSSSWKSITGTLPSQTGKADDLLTTNGTTASWTNAPINLVKLAFAGQSSAPGAPSAGTVYYNSTTNVAYVYNGSAWVPVSNVVTPTHSGGTVTTYGEGTTIYFVHTFFTSGTFTVASSGTLSVDYLVVAGGGGGGRESYSSGNGGGGGAGGFKTAAAHTVSASTSYTITVGSGGAAYGTTAGTGAQGGDGGPSIFDTITSTGGGGGGGGSSSAAGRDGGSGGGAGNKASGPGDADPTGQGNDGGDSATIAAGNAGGGGGGAGGVGGVGQGPSGSATGGAGGIGEDEIMGLTDAQTTVLLNVANVGIEFSDGKRNIGGGGGGSGNAAGGVGGKGGGGAGSGATHAETRNGVANTGGGGGGLGNSDSPPGTTGGSGVVIIRYAL